MSYRRGRWLLAGGGALLCVALVGSCSSDDTSDTPAGSLPGQFPTSDFQSSGSQITTTLVASVGEMVTGLTSDADRRVLFVTTRTGRVLSLTIEEQGDAIAPDPSGPVVELDLSQSVSVEDERGMFDIEMLPSGDRAAISYTDLDGAVTVRLLRVEGGDLHDDVDSPVVVSIRHPFAGHNGGGLAVTPDGDLFLSLGDMDAGESDEPISQDPSTPLGGILRIPAERLDSGPLPVTVDAEHMVAKGLRNPWRISYDAPADTLWVGDVGQETWEEISALPSAGERTDLANFGWPAFEGREPFKEGITLIDGPRIDPAHVYNHEDAGCSVSLGPVYRGSAIADLEGVLLFGDFCSPEVRSATVDGTELSEVGVALTLDDDTIVGFGEDARGEVYVLTPAGNVYRLDPPGWSAPAVAPTELSTDEAQTTTTSTPPEPAQSECDAVVALVKFGEFAQLPAEQLEPRLTELLESIRAAKDDAPERRRQAYEDVEATFTDVYRMLEAEGFDIDRARAQGIVDELSDGTGLGEGFPQSITSIMEVADSCT